MIFIKDEIKFAYSWDECVYLLLLKDLNPADYLTPKELSTEHFHFFSVLVDIFIILVFEIFLRVVSVLWWCSPHFLLQHPTSNLLVHPLPPSCLSCFLRLWHSVSDTPMLEGVGLSTGAWATYQWLQPQRALVILPATTVVVNTSSAQGGVDQYCDFIIVDVENVVTKFV